MEEKTDNIDILEEKEKIKDKLFTTTHINGYIILIILIQMLFKQLPKQVQHMPVDGLPKMLGKLIVHIMYQMVNLLPMGLIKYG